MRRTALIWPAVLAVIAIGLAVWRFQDRQRPSPPPPQAREETGGGADGETLVTIYFANRAYIESGDESLPHLLPEERRMPADNPAEAAVRALQAGPRVKGGEPVIRGNLKVRGVAIRNGLAEVDIARANLFGGSLEELLLVEGVVRTLTGLPGVKAVRFLVDGEPADTLMGHISVDKPLTAAELP